MVDEAENPASAGPESRRQKISTQKLREFYENDLLPLIGAEGTADNPRFNVVFGQPGSGKSTTVRLLAGSAGATQVINADELGACIGRYAGLVLPPNEKLEQWEQQDHLKSLYGWLIDRALDKRQNVITEAVKQSQARQLVEKADRHGYPARLHAIAAPKETSFRRVFLRRQRGLANGTADCCVVGDQEWHDSWYHDTPGSLHAIEEEKLFGRITVRRPDGSELYNNVLFEQGDGTFEWNLPRGAVEALIKGRHEPPNIQEIERDWAIITSSALLKADPDCRDLPLDDYRKNALASATERGHFDLAKPDPSHRTQSAHQYLSAVARDLNETIGSVDEGNAAALLARFQAFWQKHQDEVSENLVQSRSVRASGDAKEYPISSSHQAALHQDPAHTTRAGSGRSGYEPHTHSEGR